jgi:hypothetical protein
MGKLKRLKSTIQKMKKNSDIKSDFSELKEE